MAKQSSNFGTILASVLITLTITSAGVYFGLPILFPNLTETPSPVKQDIVVQTKYQESRSAAWIFESTTTPTKINNTEMNITTQGNSKLAVTFDAILLIYFQAGFDTLARYNITLQVEGIKQRYVPIYFQSYNPETEEYTMNLHIFFETELLTAGTYIISLIWYSISDTAIPTRLSFGIYLDENLNPTRSLYVQEIIPAKS